MAQVMNHSHADTGTIAQVIVASSSEAGTSPPASLDSP